MTEQLFDVIVIGGGPGGYVAAIKAAQLGLKVAAVEERKTLGGTCLNVGCIPSKALLNISEKYQEAKTEFSHLGIIAEKVRVDLSKMMAVKEKTVADLTGGISFLFQKNKVTHLLGRASLKGEGVVDVKGHDGKTTSHKAKSIIIATGSLSSSLPHITPDEKNILTSTGALGLKKVPETLLVIGGGYIGLEMASVWMRLGSRVTVVEYADTIVPMMDKDISASLKKELEEQGMTFALGTEVLSVKEEKKALHVKVRSKVDKKETVIEAEKVLMSVGRRPHTEGLSLETVGIQKDERGFIKVNERYETSCKGVYAIGDVIPGPMLAHKAEEEGVAVAEILAGQKGHVNYGAIPGVIYTMPEAAGVGKTEQELITAGVPYKVGKFPFSANSRAKANQRTKGFVKILADKTTDRVLGVHILAADAGTLIAECVLALEYKASAEDIARTCHAHPTTNEAVKEAALEAYFKAIHK